MLESIRLKYSQKPTSRNSDDNSDPIVTYFQSVQDSETNKANFLIQLHPTVQPTEMEAETTLAAWQRRSRAMRSTTRVGCINMLRQDSTGLSTRSASSIELKGVIDFNNAKINKDINEKVCKRK